MVGACLLAAVAQSSALESKQGRKMQDTYPKNQAMEGPEYEIVIARFMENSTTLAWLSELPAFYQVTIINKVRCSESLRLYISYLGVMGRDGWPSPCRGESKYPVGIRVLA